jgi:myosin heavy subunit
VLHLGQLEYDKSTFDEGKGTPVSIKNKDELKIIAELYGVTDVAAIEKYLTMKLVPPATKNDKEAWSVLKFEDCKANRDSLCKQIFNCMFNWLVKRMNITIQPPDIAEESFKAKSKTIGLLDIFGFENFPDKKPNVSNNNFEQLCINYVNEKLHKLYISAIFEFEKSELRAEGLAEQAENIEFKSTVEQIIALIDFDKAKTPYYKKMTPE